MHCTAIRNDASAYLSCLHSLHASHTAPEKPDCTAINNDALTARPTSPEMNRHLYADRIQKHQREK